MAPDLAEKARRYRYGRGEMQIAILVEQMRREGYEVLVSRPEVLWHKGPDDQPLEPLQLSSNPGRDAGRPL